MNVVITGGAGFIGSNSTAMFLQRGDSVTVFDNLARTGSQKNIGWLKSLGGKLKIVEGDIRNVEDLGKIGNNLAEAGLILHLAAQVAVTTSVQKPIEDFEINAGGTLNLLELMRKVKAQGKLIYSSTNKVYGGMEDASVEETRTRYQYTNYPKGISEARLLDFHSPYGCSKGAADQYVRDYSRIYGLDTVVFRQSCIYGPRQFGVEDQGWVAWFVIATALNKPLTVYGDGKQVRDLLYVTDLVAAYDAAYAAGIKSKGQIYNIGGGVANILSVWTEFGPLLERLFGRRLSVTFGPWRPGDQRIYVSDISKASKELGWKPKMSVENGITELHKWVTSDIQQFA